MKIGTLWAKLAKKVDAVYPGRGIVFELWEKTDIDRLRAELDRLKKEVDDLAFNLRMADAAYEVAKERAEEAERRWAELVETTGQRIAQDEKARKAQDADK